MIVADHPVFRAGIRAMLGGNRQFKVVGEVAGNDVSSVGINGLKPEVVLLALNEPDAAGVEIVRRIAESDHGAKVVAMAMNSETLFAQDILDVGAVGYVANDGGWKELTHAIKVVTAGGIFLSGSVGPALIRGMPPDPCVQHRAQALTRREREVLALYLHCSGPKEVAKRLGPTTNSIKTHLRRIRGKVGRGKWARMMTLRAKRLAQ